MITLTREEAQQVLDALETITSRPEPMSYFCSFAAEIETLRVKLSTPEPEPVAWCACRWDSEDKRIATCERHQGWLDVIAEWADRAREAEQKLRSKNMDRQCPSCGGFCKKSGCERENIVPPQREWQGLTDEEKRECFQTMYDAQASWPVYADAIEAKLREKNI